MPPRSVFHDVAEFVALPRLTRLVLSPDGTRLVACVEQATEDRDRYRSSLWELDPAGVEPPRRLTHSEQGESSPAFVGDGSLLFTSTRPGPQGDPPDVPALWLLPPRGDAVRVATSPGGLSGPVGARASTAYVVATSRLRDADAEEDERWRRDRDRAKVTAILHDGFPVRHWDHDLGPDFPRLLAARTDDGTPPRDLAPDAGPALVEASYSLTPDGTTLVTTWTVREPRGRTRTGLVAIDVATGDRRTVVEEADVDYRGPVVSPDGARVAAVRRAVGDVATPTTWAVYVQGLAGGPGRSFDLTEELTPTELVWSPDSSTLYVAGDRRGRGAVVALDVTTGGYRRIASDAVYSSLSVSPDGAAIYALRSTIDCPPQPVRLDAHATDGAPTRLPSPAPAPDPPGELVEVEAAAPDGAPVHGWLVLPAGGDGPAPLQLWIHGGPFASWNAWSWRWCPWVPAARGWAVLLPDPALSTGYGQAWIERAWPHRAALVWRDIEALLDAVVARHDVDAGRVACLGGSFGGYMANWIAGHTGRFRAIVTHAGLWALDQQHATTDLAEWKTRLMGTPAEHPDWYAENSPHHFADAITTPMLVIHGNRDYRVPYTEGLRLFWDLVSRHGGDPATLPHRFLQFTGENHWILSPANARIWYECVLAFLDWHVLGGTWRPPRLA
ncbi:MAG: prolyl oligopeptidase family serine peptidase [Micromonosporaceae bacterium]|jgi:dipeptidyl aminopeptidase/acylaminoacyl peptidase